MTEKNRLINRASIDLRRCAGCGACIKICPKRAIHMKKGWISWVDQTKCSGCGKCVNICHKKAPDIIRISHS